MVTRGDAIAAYAGQVNADSAKLRAAGYKAVPMDGTGEVATNPVTQVKSPKQVKSGL